MNLNNITQRLQSAGLGTIGENIFQSAFPADITNGILVRPGMSGVQLDEELPGLLKFDLQVIIRSVTHFDGEVLAKQCLDTLKMREGTLGTWTVKYIRPMNIPYGFPLSPGGLREFVVRFAVCVHDPDWIV